MPLTRSAPNALGTAHQLLIALLQRQRQTMPPTQVSLFGGAVVTLAGTGLVTGLVDAARNRSMTADWVAGGSACGAALVAGASACAWFAAPSPPAAAADAGLFRPQLVSSDGASATLSFRRFTLADVAAALGLNASTAGFAPDAAYLGNATVRGPARVRAHACVLVMKMHESGRVKACLLDCIVSVWRHVRLIGLCADAWSPSP
jgi:hypothetical protein